ncbi:hypothetical protein BDR26DRAFT_930905 [Obelidium mucronatum]|nr:hypothetical protein BDR26DRAFT_930905 [Obelidium mucronatum]
MPASNSVYVLSKYVFILTLAVVLGASVVASATASAGFPGRLLSQKHHHVGASFARTNSSSSSFAATANIKHSVAPEMSLWDTLSTLAGGFLFVLQVSAVFTGGLYVSLFGIPKVIKS